MKRNRTQYLGFAAGVAGLSLILAACAPPEGDSGEAMAVERDDIELQPDETAEGFDYDELVAAAQEEGPITIYDETGKVADIAAAFTEKYGIEANGVKQETNTVDMMEREHAAGNIVGDVLAVSEPPAVYAELIRDGVLTNWVPGDVREKLPEEARFPYLTSNQALWWSYNPDAYGDQCPVSNVWELTEDKWSGNFAMPDPEARAMYTNAWNQSARNHSDDWAEAYEDHYGESLETDEESAFHEWLKRLAQNSPIVFSNDEDVSEAVGAPGQDDPPMGQMHAAKYRNVENLGYSLAPCDGLQPFAGSPVPQTMGYASDTDSPNAAKLYIHFATSQEGMEFIMEDGKFSYNDDIQPESDGHGVFEIFDQTQPFDTENLVDDYQNTVNWHDFWRSNR